MMRPFVPAFLLLLVLGRAVKRTFQPGKIGAEVQTDGLVKNIDEGGQAEQLGVQRGWTYRYVDGESFTLEVLKARIRSGEPYEVTFQQPDEDDADDEDAIGAEASKAFLAKNEKKEGVISLPSGLQYRVIRPGSGTGNPLISSECECIYEGEFIDGTPFTSSKKGVPSLLKPIDVIMGWRYAMMSMVEGDEWELFIPAKLAYGPRGRTPKIPPNAALVFKLHLLKINGPTTPKDGTAPPRDKGKQLPPTPPWHVPAGQGPEASKKFLEENKLKEGVVTLPSGLQYKVLEKGSGKRHPRVNTPCECHYKGTLVDGKGFDSSYKRGKPSTFKPNQVVKGWTEALQLMVEGDKWELYVPSELGYGERGRMPSIPGGAALIFTLELLKIKFPDDEL